MVAQVDTVTITHRLRTETADLHHRAEQHPLQAGFVKGEVSLTLFATWLRQLQLIHETLETEFQDAESPALREVIMFGQFKARRIEADLRILPDRRAFGIAVPTVARATRRLCWRIRDAVADEPLNLIGFWYVLEGAANGNKFLYKALSRAFGSTDGLSYLDPYGDDLRRHWARWKQNLDRLDLSERQADGIVRSAKIMFLGITEISTELWNELPCRDDGRAA